MHRISFQYLLRLFPVSALILLLEISLLQIFKRSNEHEIEKLMKQHEVDLDNLKETHKLEMVKLEAEHRYSLELASANAQNEMTKQLMGSFVGNMLAAPQMQDFLMNAITDSFKKGEQD